MTEETNTIDWSKPVRTRDGRAVRVLCTDCESPSGYPVVALVKDSYGYDRVQSYTLEGKYRRTVSENPNDLENVPEVTNLWVNVYTNDISGHTSKKEAEYWAENGRVALLRLTIVDGILVGMEIEG